MKEAIHRSPRGHILSWLFEPVSQPVVCVELYCKWYDLYVIHPDGSIESRLFPEMRLSPDYCDHTPNPQAVQRWAQQEDYQLCHLALEIIIGRWEIEYKNNYPIPGEE